MALPAEKERYTYADYLNWDEPDRYELVDGIPVALASPSENHQRVLMELGRQLANFLDGKPCKVYPAPFDVRLFEEKGDTPDDVNTVFQPDLMVVCDSSKVDNKGVHGAPDLIIEILSHSTARQDRIVKMNRYQQAGVKEYWIVSPEELTVEKFVLDGGAFRLKDVYTRASAAEVSVLQDCKIDLLKVFPDDEPPAARLREAGE